MNFIRLYLDEFYMFFYSFTHIFMTTKKKNKNKTRKKHISLGLHGYQADTQLWLCFLLNTNFWGKRIENNFGKILHEFLCGFH